MGNWLRFVTLEILTDKVVLRPILHWNQDSRSAGDVRGFTFKRDRDPYPETALKSLADDLSVRPVYHLGCSWRN